MIMFRFLFGKALRMHPQREAIMPQILEENIEHKTLEYQDKVYCVHRVDENIVKQINNLPPDVLLTFDDCLYSQYYYADKIINQNRIYFCCPTLINNSNTFICDIECELIPL